MKELLLLTLLASSATVSAQLKATNRNGQETR